MSSTPVNRYRGNLRDAFFLLFEQFKINDYLGKDGFADWGEEEVRAALRECHKFAQEVYGPLNAAGDVGCTVVDGRVKTPEGFKDAWKQTYENGWPGISMPTEHGGQGAPVAVRAFVEELLSGSNPAFNMYPGLAFGAAELLHECGTPAQGELYIQRMISGQWAGTMCLTEPHAGSDVGSATTRAEKRADGTYAISGTKIFISGGDNDLCENVIHLVLARLEGAPPGTKGLSLFIVPRERVSPTGELLGSNNVTLGGIEHKMGINGSATCVLNFGDGGDTIGELVGGIENAGMSQMFVMMNGARLAVGIQGVSCASAAYMLAVDYAKERKQGSSLANFKDPKAPRVPIIEHPDVRRMLLDMKSRVEGIRALIVKLATHTDRAHALSGKDDAAVGYHRGQVDLLTPLVKSYGSDQAFRVCETAIQTLGGAGYIKDYGVEQYCRDAKIFSIYEGTNHIQAMDLVGRKLGMQGGAHLQNLLGDVQKFLKAQAGNAELKKEIEALSAAQEAVMGSAMRLLGWFQGGNVAMVPLNANRFLEMMSETVVGWLLLEQAVLAQGSLPALAAGHPDKAFYEGKIAAARYFARNVLPGVGFKLSLLLAEDDSPVAISDDAFAPS
jgi:alkylation response protein AidB-like acyl-CoA dehydrogenase